MQSALRGKYESEYRFAEYEYEYEGRVLQVDGGTRLVDGIGTVMAFYFTCPYCLQKTLVSEELSGQSGPCVGCGKLVTIPRPPSARAAEIAPAEERDAPPVVELKRRRFSPAAVKAGIFVIAAIPIAVLSVWMLAPTIVQLKARRDITACKQNLKRIAQALNAYADEYGVYPPPAVLDARGKPMHTWRVLILPYLGEKRLYEMYDMTKPWDSPENSSLQARMPAVFRSPGISNPLVMGESSYMLVTGPGTMFPPTGPVARNLVTDGAGNTLLVVETNNQSVPWTEPQDLDIAKLPAQIGALGGIGGAHQGGATAVLVDGEAVWLPADTSKAIIDSMLSPSGGEAVEGAWFR